MNKLEKKKQQNKKIFNKWAASYDWSVFQFWMRRFQTPLEKEIVMDQKTKIIDISCGTGELLKRWQGKASLTGVDIAERMLEEARNKLPKDVTLIRADVNKLPFPREEFDYTISTEAFHHYYPQTQALEEMKRITKKGGKVIIIDINFFFPLIHRIFEKIEPGCIKVNDKKEMKRLFKKAGLIKIKQERSFIFAVMTIGTKES